MSALFSWLSGLFGPKLPPLVAVTKRCTGATVNEALTRFEDAWSDENFQNVEIQEQAERRDGLLVRYEVRWKYSVLDDGAYSTHVSWALLVPADPAAGDPADARFRVASATTEHHMREMSQEDRGATPKKREN